MTTRRALKVLAGAAVVAIVVAAAIRLNKVTVPEGPVPIVWDREVCAHCSMHIGERAFAAQLQLKDGRIDNFDDPGCLFEFLSEDKQPVHAIYFRDHAADRWLARDEARFVPVESSPMGYGIGAVGLDTKGANTWAWAEARVEQKREERR